MRVFTLCGVLLLATMTMARPASKQDDATSHHPRRAIIEAHLLQGAISPKGHKCLVGLVLQGFERSLDHWVGIVDLTSGHVGAGVRYLPVGRAQWNARGTGVLYIPRGKLSNEATGPPGIIWLDVPALSLAWKTPEHALGAAWTPDGRGIAIALGQRHAPSWRLVMVSRNGAVLEVLRHCHLIPHAVVRRAGQSGIVCSTGLDAPEPLSFVALDGSTVSHFGPHLGAGHYYFAQRMDKLAWQGTDTEGHPGPIVLAQEQKGVWTQRALSVPPLPPRAVYERISPIGQRGLLLAANDAWHPIAAWRLLWSGRRERLQVPRNDYPLAFLYPSADGSHLIRVAGSSIEVIDPDRGVITSRARIHW